jgi:hypothetical protein
VSDIELSIVVVSVVSNSVVDSELPVVKYSVVCDIELSIVVVSAIP